MSGSRRPDGPGPEPALDLLGRPLVHGLPAQENPGLVRVPVDDPREAVFLPVPLTRMGQGQELGARRDGLELVHGEDLVPLLDAADEPLGHAADLVVDDELLQALAALEIEHARPGDDVDPGQGGEDRADPGLQPGLGVVDLGVGRAPCRRGSAGGGVLAIWA